MSIILIGMPSCGKSTLGVLLAKRLGYRFVDSDLLIQEKTGKLLHEIISEEGSEGFIRIENEINRQITDENAVIATGGSVIYGEEAMAHLIALGKVVYLKIPYEEMCRRLGDFSHRGVVMRQGNTLEEMYNVLVSDGVPISDGRSAISIFWSAGNDSFDSNVPWAISRLFFARSSSNSRLASVVSALSTSALATEPAWNFFCAVSRAVLATCNNISADLTSASAFNSA